jgi:hypothetical protein
METYTTPSSDPALFARGLPIGIITDALTGRSTAVYRGGFSIVLDEPLCAGCDEPADRCGCMELAPVVRLSARRVAA